MRAYQVALAMLLVLAGAARAEEELTSIVVWEFEHSGDDRDRFFPGQYTALQFAPGHIGREAVFNGKTSAATYGSQSAWTFSRRDSFTIDFWLKTAQTPAGIATVIMARNPGDVPNWSFVLAGRDARYGRIPGHLSFEMWTWDRQRINSHDALNDGQWHRVQAYFDRATAAAVMAVDEEIQGAMTLETNYTGAPVRLVFGNNVSDDQPYQGLLDSIRLYSGVPARITTFAQTLQKSRQLGRAKVEAGYDAWLARLQRPKPIQASGPEPWKKRRLEVRAEVLADLGLAPFPYSKDKPGDLLPLDVRFGEKRDYDDYSAQAIAWQVWKGVYARGFLYLPRNRGTGPFPAILNPHGHFALSTAAPEVQSRCIGLAKQGYIALSVQSTHPEDLMWGITPMTGMQWGNMRALDYLCTRPDVDQSRLGCTGCSGGGEQTVYLMCADDRLDAAVPAVYASYSKEIMPSRGWTHCNCNWVPGLLGDTDEPEMAAVFAPKPLFFISNLQDWTADWETQGRPDVRRVYAWESAAGQVSNVTENLPHGYPKPWRELMYAFFNREFMRSDHPAYAEPEGLPILSPAEMEAMLPRVPTCEARVDVLAAEFAERLGKRLATPRDSREAERLQYNLRERLRSLLREPLPTRGAAAPTLIADHLAPDYRLRLLHVSTEPEITVPALLVTRLHAGGALPLVVLVDHRGKEVVFTEEEKLWRGLLAQGAGVLIPDVRYWGELSTGDAWSRYFGNFVGRPPAAVATHDVLELVRSLRSTGEFDRRRVVVMGIGDGAVITLLAGALDRDLAGVAGTDVGPTYRQGRPSPLCTGVLQVGDLDDLACLAAPRPLAWIGVADAAAYDQAAVYARLLRARSQLIAQEPESRERLGLLTWYSTLGKAR